MKLSPWSIKSVRRFSPLAQPLNPLPDCVTVHPLPSETFWPAEKGCVSSVGLLRAIRPAAEDCYPPITFTSAEKRDDDGDSMTTRVILFLLAGNLLARGRQWPARFNVSLNDLICFNVSPSTAADSTAQSGK